MLVLMLESKLVLAGRGEERRGERRRERERGKSLGASERGGAGPVPRVCGQSPVPGRAPRCPLFRATDRPTKSHPTHPATHANKHFPPVSAPFCQLSQRGIRCLATVCAPAASKTTDTHCRHSHSQAAHHTATPASAQRLAANGRLWIYDDATAPGSPPRLTSYGAGTLARSPNHTSHIIHCVSSRPSSSSQRCQCPLSCYLPAS